MRPTWLVRLSCLMFLTACDGDDDCYSPKRNLDRVYDRGATGCSCDPSQDPDVCVPSSTGGRVALVCLNGSWAAVQDGPCLPSPQPGDCVSPTQNIDRAYEPGAFGCPCDHARDEGVCIPDSTGRRVAFVCLESNVWRAVEDGPCLP